jgi:nicotinamide-nucleotide amidase
MNIPLGALTVSAQQSLPDLLVEAARKVIDANRAAGRTIALAESCTGGLVTAALTEIPGSSDVLEASFVTYSNDAKLELLGVSRDVLETFGAVSIAVAWAMARGALERTHADVAVAITGIAGPGGGSEKRPVGTVVFARAEKGDDPNDVTADKHEFGDLGRGPIRLQAALCALDLLMPVASDAPVDAPAA